MANRYLVGSGAFNSTSIWSATYGGSSGASVPVSGDIIHVDNNYNITSNLPSSSSFDFIVYLGNNSAGGVTLGLGGSATFRTFMLLSKNSAEHTVNMDDLATITTNKFVAVGSSTTKKMNLSNPGYQGQGMLKVTNSCYGQNLYVTAWYGIDVFGTPLSDTPLYIGSGSVDGANDWGAGNALWLTQNPPKISTLVDPLTTTPASNSNWAVTGTVTKVTSGAEGGGYKSSNGRLTSTDTYDLTSSEIVLEVDGTTGSIIQQLSAILTEFSGSAYPTLGSITNRFAAAGKTQVELGGVFGDFPYVKVF